MIPSQASLPVGVVIRRTPGVTRWARYYWKVVAVLPGAGPAEWRELRREGDAVEYHAGTATMHLYRADTEAYLHALNARQPACYVVLRGGPNSAEGRALDLVLVTASPYEAQDYMEGGEEIVEQVPMPPGLVAFLREFVEQHHHEEVFVKRRRNKERIDRKEDGKGDARIRQAADVYRSPASRKGRAQ
ncbi:DUF3305 domain-containing protein [Oceanibium sediminis]|uniref:DUF3305 domain-containing protein n=1 Tax=Oceanibium sediminis TaxID=2026339 RepID=UPI000DD3E29C|nr:DUF3305 domain-containing protein [Oceanibium sediminis]